MKFDKIIFDFDGVILNSHNVKTQAFYDLFKKYGKEIAYKSKNYHLENTGISRFVKFNHILKNFVKKKKNKKLVEKLSKQFSKICLKKIDKLKISKSLLNFFNKNSDKYKLYISTGTPQQEIRKILYKKNLLKYFKNIYGSPMKKVQHIDKIVKKNNLVLFIGDSYEDYYASKKKKISFLLKVHTENKNTLGKLKVKKIYNFSNIEKILKSYFK